MKSKYDALKATLSPREKLIFELLIKKKSANIDQIVDHVSVGLEAKPTRRSVTITVKYLAAKIAEHGMIIRRTSGIGSGHIGVYELVKPRD